MTRKERDFITLRFRKQLDDDLKEAVKSLEDGVLSGLVRDGLRIMLGIRTTKKLQIAESILTVPGVTHEVSPESPAQDVEIAAAIDLQRTPSRESIQETPAQRKEAVRLQSKPTAPYLAKSQRQ